MSQQSDADAEKFRSGEVIVLFYLGKPQEYGPSAEVKQVAQPLH